MPKFGDRSTNKLLTCDQRLQLVFNKVIKKIDCAVICGYRNQTKQDAAFINGKSKVQFPNSKHNSFPSMAADVTPYITGRGIPWPDKKDKTFMKDVGAWYLLIGYTLAIAGEMGIILRSGADWDRDWDITDQRFDDLPHFEIVE